MDDVREPVRWFARQMETKLKKNDSKRGWIVEEVSWLLDRVDEELCELRRAFCAARPIQCMTNTEKQQELLRSVIAESADVANFAMMIADNVRRYLPEHKRELDDKPT